MEPWDLFLGSWRKLSRVTVTPVQGADIEVYNEAETAFREDLLEGKGKAREGDIHLGEGWAAWLVIKMPYND